MARLPVIGADADSWGALLNEYLHVSHRVDGSLRGTYEVLNVRDFGAVPGDTTPAGRAKNSDAFVQAQAAMQNAPNPLGRPLFVPSGTYYLATDLHIQKSLELFGTGVQGESILMFPAGKSLIVDQGSVPDSSLNGSNCVIRDLQIKSEETWTVTEDDLFDPAQFDPPTFEGTSKGTPGIKLNTTAIIQRVYIQGFTGTGIYILAGGGSFNANQWRIHDVYINRCGGHGIHVDDGEAQGGLCSGAKIIVVGGNGIYESSFGGNTYVGCYAEVAKGRGYLSNSVGQVSFIGCFAEAKEPSHFVSGGNVWIGGSSGRIGFTAETRGFIVESYGLVYPFEVANPENRELKIQIGFPGGIELPEPYVLYAWQEKNGGDFWVKRWSEAQHTWSTENGRVRVTSASREIASYLTGTGHSRGPWLQGVRALLLGPAENAMKISRDTRPDDAAGVGEPGDIVYNTNPQVGDYIGWVCVGPDHEWKPFGKIEA